MFTALIVLFILLAGVFDALCDRRRDTPDSGLLHRWMAVKLNWAGWYYGNGYYTDKGQPARWKNNGNPFQSDFWHDAKLGRVYSWSLAVCSALALTLGWYAYLLVLPTVFIKGKTFAMFYHKVFSAI